MKTKIRIMTYNVHRCIGLDRKASALRVARVIDTYKPDIIALQELDTDHKRSGRVNQPFFIARYLNMHHYFHSSFQIGNGHHGNAILSRFPIQCKAARILPSLSGKVRSEFKGGLWAALVQPRAVIWVSFMINTIPVQFLATHLGLRKKERDIQLQTLLSPDWLGSAECTHPVIFCGDLNARPRSSVCQKLRQRLIDVQLPSKNHKPLPTFHNRLPISRIDHIFVSPEITVLKAMVPDSKLAKIASDHRPLIADLELC